MRAAKSAGGEIPDRGGGLGGSGARSAFSRTAGPGAAGRRDAGAGWTLVFALDARAGKRSAGADSLSAGHRENGSRGAASRRGGLSCKRIRTRGVTTASGKSAEAGQLGKRKGCAQAALDDGRTIRPKAPTLVGDAARIR